MFLLLSSSCIPESQSTVTRCRFTAPWGQSVQSKQGEERTLQELARRCSSNLSPEKAAPSQMQCRENAAPIRTGPSLCPAVSGWKLTLWIW